MRLIYKRTCRVVVGLIVLWVGFMGMVHGSEVVRATLKNGPRVVIVPNDLVPVATTMVNGLVAPNEAPTGSPGTVHAREHMMFRGSPGLSADQLANLTAAMGGSFNAAGRQTVI